MLSLSEIIILLLTAVITVPIVKRLGLGSILGYLVGGLIIGPYALKLVGNPESVLHIAEFGVVFFLFMVGLELKSKRLLALRAPIFGYGSLQFFTTAVLLGGVGALAGLPPTIAIIVGISLALSSTAFALQMLAEKQQLSTRHGRYGFAILLFQDLMVAPLLALLPLMADGESEGNVLASFLFAVLVVTLLIIFNRFLVRPLFHYLAAANSREILTAAALLLVLLTAVVAHSAGLSMALGAFLAGVILADSEFRHELEADIEPFKSMLLGLFFIAIGMMIDIHLLIDSPLKVLLLVLLLMTIKGAVLYVIGRINRLNHRSSLLLASYLGQGGEFAFVILTVAVGHQLLNDEQNALIIMVVSLSMAMTPLMIALVEKFVSVADTATESVEDIPEQYNPVVIAGFGRVGQIVARILAVKEIPFTALESRSDQVDFVRQFGNKVYYGDATRLEVLKSAGLQQAKIMILAIQNIEASVKTANLVNQYFPHIQLYARARNRKHAHLLMDAGVQHVTRDTLHSSLLMAETVLCNLGEHTDAARKTVEIFRQYDEDLFRKQHAYHHDQQQLIESVREISDELRELFRQDQKEDKKAD